jgi:hypothetical protein
MDTLTEKSFQLPALRNLSDLAESAPTIIIDTREQNPLIFECLKLRGNIAGR